jgi:hypothetical protein
MEKVTHTIAISSNIGHGCEHCHGRFLGAEDDISDSINHLISEHGYRLLHIGTQTSHAGEGLWHSTVAVLGHDDPPPSIRIEGPVKITFKET